MRSRSNSGVRLDFFHRLLEKTIFINQNAVTGLFRSSNKSNDAWVRDNVYAIMAVWGLSMAYRKQADLDEDRAKAYALEQDVVRSMRALLTSMMKQVEKVEMFKHSQSPEDSLHAKYSSLTGHTCVGDQEWGHLQIDATSLFLLMLSQMTASGLQIVFTLDEVDFIQNLVFYIENAYRIPDYGIWERGDKTNHGFPELNASSIGMAKAAMEAVNELDLFCARGGASSVIHVKSDKVAQCQAILHSMLPRESNSKEVDAGLLSVIGFPAFAVDDESILNHTKDDIMCKLQGKYGCKRFLRDGYKTVKEDPNRMYYESAELKIFENIECEWPVFYIFLMLDGIFSNNKEQISEYHDAIDDLMIYLPDASKVIPELYYVPEEKVDLEYKTPGSQDRKPGGQVPHLWSQSLFILAMLMKEKFITPGEVDPLNRRQSIRPKPDLVVQVAVLAEDTLVQQILKSHDIVVQTVAEAAPIFIYPARVLIHVFKHLGENKKMELTGNVCGETGVLGTSMLYTLHGKILAFVPQFLDHHQFYLALDNDLLADLTKNDISFLRNNWRELGRPTVTITVTHGMIANESIQASILSNIRKFQTGYINGVQVQMGNLGNLISTSCIKRLTFLESEHPSDASLARALAKHCIHSSYDPVWQALVLGQTSDHDLHPGVSQPSLPPVVTLDSSDDGASTPQSTSSMEGSRKVHGIISRTRSIDMDVGVGTQATFRLLAESVSTKFSTPKHTNHLPAVTELGGSFERTLQKAKSFCVGDGRFDDGTSALLSPLSPSMDEEHFVLPDDSTDTASLRKTASWLDTTELLELYAGQEDAEIVEQLKACTSLSEQADMVHYLFESKGLDWNTNINETSEVTVKNLMEELYYKSAKHRTWSLVRHAAGILQKRVEHLAQSVTDLLVRQKQVSVGLPPEPREQIITAPLPPNELEKVIYNSCGDDRSCAVLTQELLIYLSLFIRTEPHLFTQMFRLRVGLIMQVMTSELARAMNCDAEDAYEQLVTLSPYELKELLHHILSGREFGVSITSSKSSRGSRLLNRQPTIVSAPKEEVAAGSTMNRRFSLGRRRSVTRQPTSIKELFEEEVLEERYGLWLRRRRVDGSLNRAPADFYPKVWKLLELCPGIRIAQRFLPQNLTREMTSNEFKFALAVETALNSVPEPEFRQLMVEALVVLALVIEKQWLPGFSKVIDVGQLVNDANGLFLADQAAYDGDALACCASTDPTFQRPYPLSCEGSAGICEHFYDSAPSGSYGTMIYMTRAALNYFNIRQMFEGTDRVECKPS
ncbi:probable phosphorylase b kinase regulatory subunit alpha isoform X4 [Apostichopus japonicus]|uniref:probable phosphorylase b kinase regulatory subunit alpha isoform X4 n=1 Tax=Stichopus japonicus TaxID=307972 RepID=UPI003AB855F9